MLFNRSGCHHDRILITSDLKASQQCTQAYSKANKLLGIINRPIVYKSQEVMLKLYTSVVCPHLEYCISAWNPHNRRSRT